MKKMGIVFVTLMVAATIGFVGCGGTPRAPAVPPAEPLTVDLSLLAEVRNPVAFTQRWDDFLIVFPEGMFDGVDFRAFQRVTITANYFDIDGNQLDHGDDLVMVTLIYDPLGDLRGPPDGPGPNTPLKQFNVGGPFGSIHTERGSIMRLTRTPGAVLFQNSQLHVRYIEVTEITFHNR